MSDIRRDAELLKEITTGYRSLVNNFLDFSAKLNSYFQETAKRLEEQVNDEFQHQGTSQQAPNRTPKNNTITTVLPPKNESNTDDNGQASKDCNEPLCPNRPQPSPSTMAHTGYIHLPFTEESRTALLKYIPPEDTRELGGNTKDECLTISCPKCCSKLEIKVEVKQI
ncbi:unnamed protein product [Orchesella dallaii]|uniref:Uncharacterized protein n=1 Tax=Orchesella dallaii TaxID=48710 RepID=A0ABP1QQV1_9HEXA